MDYKIAEIAAAAKVLLARLNTLEDKRAILRAPELAALYVRLKNLPASERADFGKEVNLLKNNLQVEVNKSTTANTSNLRPIDVSAPFDINIEPANRPMLLPAGQGSIHPINQELSQVLDIFYRMGFCAEESREIDDDYHMFTSLNFPPDHPARDDYDTFITTEGLIAPAHTSTMQNRVMKKYRQDLLDGKGIRAVIPGRVFRNEDLDARHEHTFYQLEGVYVDEGINAGHLISTLKTFLETYFGQDLEFRTQPYYFPFTEPSFEIIISCPFCKKAGCNVCSYIGWIELLGCGMIHPNVLKDAGIDASKYTGFAWGMGIERLVMMKAGVEDVRHFESANLKFLRQF